MRSFGVKYLTSTQLDRYLTRELPQGHPHQPDVSLVSITSIALQILIVEVGGLYIDLSAHYESMGLDNFIWTVVYARWSRYALYSPHEEDPSTCFATDVEADEVDAANEKAALTKLNSTEEESLSKISADGF